MIAFLLGGINFISEVKAYLSFIVAGALLLGAAFAWWNIPRFGRAIAVVLLLCCVAMASYAVGVRTAELRSNARAVIDDLKQKVENKEFLLRLHMAREAESQRQVAAAEEILSAARARQSATEAEATDAKERANDYAKELARGKDTCDLNDSDLEWMR